MLPTYLFRVNIRMDTGLSASSEVAKYLNGIAVAAMVRIDPVLTYTPSQRKGINNALSRVLTS